MAFFFFFKSFKDVIWKNFFASRLSGVVRTMSLNFVKSFIDVFSSVLLNLKSMIHGKRCKLLFVYSVFPHTLYS